MDILDSLHWRYATKVFDANKKVPDDIWKKLEEVLVLTPSSYGLQPWKFLIVKNPDVRQKLKEHSWGQSQVTDASHFVVFLARNSIDESYIQGFVDFLAKERGIDPAKLTGYKNMMIGDLINGFRSNFISEWAIRQVYIALGNLLTSAAVLGVDACPMEGLDPKKYNEILQIEPNYETVCACAVGYRSTSDSYASLKKVRFNNLISYI